MHRKNGLKFGLLMYFDYLQKWLGFSYGLTWWNETKVVFIIIFLTVKKKIAEPGSTSSPRESNQNISNTDIPSMCLSPPPYIKSWVKWTLSLHAVFPGIKQLSQNLPLLSLMVNDHSIVNLSNYDLSTIKKQLLSKSFLFAPHQVSTTSEMPKNCHR